MSGLRFKTQGHIPRYLCMKELFGFLKFAFSIQKGLLARMCPGENYWQLDFPGVCSAFGFSIKAAASSITS